MLIFHSYLDITRRCWDMLRPASGMSGFLSGCLGPRVRLLVGQLGQLAFRDGKGDPKKDTYNFSEPAIVDKSFGSTIFWDPGTIGAKKWQEPGFSMCFSRFFFLNDFDGPRSAKLQGSWELTIGVVDIRLAETRHRKRHTLWLCQNSYWKWPLIVDLAIKYGDFP